MYRRNSFCLDLWNGNRATHTILRPYRPTFFVVSVPYSPYFPHLKGYVSQKDERNLLITSFEAMKKCPENVIKEVAFFLNIDVTSKEVTEIKIQTSFEVMKNNSSTNYEHWDHFGLRHRHEGKFFRRGIVGGHKDELSLSSNLELDEWINSHNHVKIDFEYTDW